MLRSLIAVRSALRIKSAALVGRSGKSKRLAHHIAAVVRWLMDRGILEIVPLHRNYLACRGRSIDWYCITDRRIRRDGIRMLEHMPLLHIEKSS